MRCVQFPGLQTWDDVKRYFRDWLDDNAYADNGRIRYSVVLQSDQDASLVYWRFHPSCLLTACELASSLLTCKDTISVCINVYSVAGGALLIRLQFVNSEMLACS